MKAEQLRKSILQLAIQGKLVPQDPNDEPASDLLERIHEEKQRLIKEGKIKKDKIDSFIYKGDDNRYYEKVGSEDKDITDDLPFEIPDSWGLVRLSTICWLGDTGKSSGERLPYLDAKTLRGKTDKNILIEGKIVDIGTKVILVDGENSGEVFDVPFRGYMGSTFKILETVSHFNLDYLNLVLDYYRDTFRGNKIGAAIPHLNKNLFRSLLVGFPPLPEQARIIAEIKKFEPLIAEYDKLEQQATKLDDEIYDKLKKSILQYAIQGKLVPQDPNDEPASVLLERIRAEKKAKLGKKYVDSYIYKGDDNCYYEKVGTKEPIRLDDMPFDIPDSWRWIRIDNLFQHNTGKALNSSNMQGVLHPYITTSNVYWGYFNLERIKEMPFTEDEFAKCSIVPGDLLVCEGGDVGRAAIWENDIPMCIQNHIHRLRAYYPMCTPFYYFAFFVYKSIGLIGGKGIGIQGLSSGALGKLIFPLPPLVEQERIVKQVEIILEKLKDED